MVSLDASLSKSEKVTSDMLTVMEAIVAEANHDPQLAELATREDGRYGRPTSAGCCASYAIVA